MIGRATGDHQMAQELRRHESDVKDVRRRAHRWRLADCDEPTLSNMRRALIDEMLRLEERLKTADRYFLQCIESSEPLATADALQQINRLTSEWTGLNEHLQEIDEALTERHLHNRLIIFFRGERMLRLFDQLVFVSIIAAVLITFVELTRYPGIMPPAQFIVIDTVVCTLLLFDFLLRLYYVEDRGWYWRRYWIDFFASIPLIALLPLGQMGQVALLGRPLRLVRVVRLLRLLRLGRAMRSFRYSLRGLEQLSKTFRLNLLKRAMIITIVLLFVGAVMIALLEAPAGDGDRFAENLWWSFTTIVTGGFADIYDPKTLWGRVVTGVLVLLGFVVTGIFTASLTSVLIGDESEDVERGFYALEQQLDLVTRQLDLLSTEDNRGLLALETVAQALSHQTTIEDVGEVLVQAMVDSFEALQASLHILEEDELRRVATTGLPLVTPPDRLRVGEGFVGDVARRLLGQSLRTLDIEPFDQPNLRTNGMTMVCPLVAQGELQGMLHIVLPSNLARYYLYNRAPMTLAHHAALAVYTLRTQL